MRHKLTREEQVKGGKSVTGEPKRIAGQKGFERTMELHPHMARKYLKHAKGMRAESDRFNPK